MPFAKEQIDLVVNAFMEYHTRCNSLHDQYVSRMMKAAGERLERDISRFMIEHNCAPDSALIEWRYGEYTIRLITADEKWLNWLERNH